MDKQSAPIEARKRVFVTLPASIDRQLELLAVDMGSKQLVVEVALRLLFKYEAAKKAKEMANA